MGGGAKSPSTYLNMAEGGVEKSLEDLEKEIICGICHDHYREPKVLPCCHYYCKQCIFKLSQRTGTDRPFSCPECRKTTILPQDGIDSLPTAFFVNRLQEIYSNMERVHGKVEANCEMCSGDKAEAFCRQCALFICTRCVEPHQRMKIFVGHETISLKELKEGGTLTQKPVLQTCKLHEELMKIFCFDCGCCICRDCIIKDHQGHNFEFVSVAAPEIKKSLIQELVPLTEIETKLSQALSKIRSTKLEVESRKHSLANNIESTFEEFHKIIENRKLELLAETTAQSSKKLKNLSVQEENLSMSCAVTTSVIDYTKQCVEHLSDNDIIVMHTEIQSRISKEIEDQQRDNNLDSVLEEADVAVLHSSAESLIQFCQTEARISKLAVEYTVAGEGLKFAEVNKKSEILVTAKLSGVKPPKRAHLIECSMKSLVSEKTTKCEVNPIGHNQFCIQYTPTIRGRHELTVTANGQEIAFLVFVSIHPTQLVQPVGVIAGLEDCHDVAVSSAGEILVATSAGVVVHDKKGKRLKMSDKLGLDARFYNVVVDNGSDCVYAIIATRSSTDAVKLSPDFELLKRCKIHEIAKRYLSGIAIVRDEVMVCDYNSDCIKVYTKDLCFKRQIGVQGDGLDQFRFIRGLSSDNHDNLYVSEEGKCCIKVFSNGGNFLRSFGCSQDGVNKLRCPVGVCVSGQLVYVSDHYHNDYVSVFTTEGTYVTSFGRRGKNDGEFVCVWGVCADIDGFVYVCDCGNGRIQIF